VLGRAMPSEALDEAARLGGGKGLVERSGTMGVEIVLHEHNSGGGGKVRVGKVLEPVGVIDGCARVGDLDVTPALQRPIDHEQVRRAVADGIPSRACAGRPGRRRLRDACLSNKLL
jgi:hypothetical protein